MSLYLHLLEQLGHPQVRPPLVSSVVIAYADEIVAPANFLSQTEAQEDFVIKAGDRFNYFKKNLLMPPLVSIEQYLHYLSFSSYLDHHAPFLFTYSSTHLLHAQP